MQLLLIALIVLAIAIVGLIALSFGRERRWASVRFYLGLLALTLSGIGVILARTDLLWLGSFGIVVAALWIGRHSLPQDEPVQPLPVTMSAFPPGVQVVYLAPLDLFPTDE